MTKSVFCPNINLKEFQDLLEQRPLEAYRLWNKYMGEVPDKYYLKEDKEEKEKQEAINWFKATYPGKEISFYDFADQIGNAVRHGYVQNGVVHLWKSAKADTLYHEAYHMIFRSMLSNKVREQLYTDAKKQFGEPTQSEISDIIKNVKDFYGVTIDNTEASKLVLEEKMADGFMDFKKTDGETTGLLQSIAKWFTDLLDWIKTTLGSPITLKQAYRIMNRGNKYSNFSSRNIFRNPEQFNSLYSPSKLVDGMSEDEVDQSVEGLTYMAIKAIKDYKEELNINKLLGDPSKEGKFGSIVNSILRDLYVFNDKNLTDDKKLLSALKLFLIEREYLKYTDSKNLDKKVEYAKKFTEFCTENNIKIAEVGQSRKIKMHIIANWFGRKDPKTGNIIVPSWREKVKSSLEEKGFKITKTKKELKAIEEEQVNAAEGTHQLAYGKAFYTQDSYNRLSEKALSILSSIPILKTMRDTQTGKIFYTPQRNIIFSNIPVYYNPRDVYKWLQDNISGEEKFENKINKLKEAAETSSFMKSIYTRFASLNDSDKIIMQRIFQNEIINFSIILFGEESKIINANTNKTSKKLVKNWAAKSVEVLSSEDLASNDRSLYVKITNEDENFEEGDEEETITSFLKVKKDKYKNIENLYKNLKRIQITKNNVKDFELDKFGMSKAAEVLGELIWELGMNISSPSSLSSEDTKVNVQKILNSNTGDKKGPKDNFAAIIKNGRLDDIIKTIANVKSSATGVEMSMKTNPSNYFATEGTGVSFIADLANKFTDLSTTSVNGPTGTEYFPFNFPTPLTRYVNEITKSIKSGEGLGKYGKDNFVKNNRGTSIMFKALLEDPEYLEQFKSSTLLGVKDSDMEAFEVEDVSDLNHYITRLQAFINNNNKKYFRVFISNEGDRGKFHDTPIPRINAGIFEGYRNSNIIKDSIIDELYRIRQARINMNNGVIIPGYNDNETSRAFNPELFQIALLDKDNEWIVQDFNITRGNKISDLIDDYVKMGPVTPELKSVENSLKEMVEKSLEVYNAKANKIALEILNAGLANEVNKDFVKNYARLVGKTEEEGDRRKKVGLKEANDQDVLIWTAIFKDFLIAEDYGKNEIIKLTRGNRAMFKNNDAFTKRQKTLTTPQNPVVTTESMKTTQTAGEITAAPLTYSDFVFNDPKGSISESIRKQHTDWVNNTKEMLRASNYNNGNNGFTENLISQLDEYLPGNFEELDGVSYISLKFYRDLVKGGVINKPWEDYHEEAYKNYMANPDVGFVYPKNFNNIPRDKKAGDAIVTSVLKPYSDELINIGGINAPKLGKTAYFLITKDYTRDKPEMNDIRQRMELNPNELDSPYIRMSLKPIDVAYSNSSQKGIVLNAHSFVKDSLGNYQKGQLSNVVLNQNSTGKLGFPQTLIPYEGDIEKSETLLGVQVKKNAISNIKKDSMYYYNAGLSSEVAVTGEELFDLYHGAFDEKIKRGIKRVDKALGMDKLIEVHDKLRKSLNTNESQVTLNEEFIKTKLTVLKRVRAELDRSIEKSKMAQDVLDSLDILIDPKTNIPRFTLSIDLPAHKEIFQRAILKLYENESFDQYVKGYEAVQTGIVGGFETNKTLSFLEIKNHPSNKANKTRLVHAEIMIRSDIAKKYGINPGDDLSTKNIPEELLRLIGYRIPNQDKATVIIFKIARFLPESYSKAIVIPPQVVKLMGSDFDVDKMFLLFKNIDENGDKINPRYTEFIMRNSLERASDKELDNLILDSIEAVLSNPEHYSETLFPSNAELADRIKDKLLEDNPNLAITREFSAGEYEKESGTALRESIKMRGLHSNALSGRNVATYGVVNVKEKFAIKIIGDQLRTAYLDRAPDSDFFGEDRGITTDKIHSRYIHKSVDATNSMDHFHIMNDNILTYNVQLMWKAFYPNTEMMHYFLNQPIIRDFVKTFKNEYKGNLREINNVYKKVVDNYKLDNMPQSYKTIEKTLPMDAGEIMSFSLKPKVALINFVKLFLAGRQLSEFHKVITPDASSGAARVEEINAILDRFEKYSNPRYGKIDGVEIAFYGRTEDENIIDQFFPKKASKTKSVYRYSNSYMDLFTHLKKVASIITPITESRSFEIMTNAIKSYSDSLYLSSAQYRDITNALTLLVLTKEDSPIFDMLNKPYSDDLYKTGRNKKSLTLYKRIEMARAKYPNLQSNQFIMSLEEVKTDAANFKTFSFDSSRQYSGDEKTRIKDDLNLMITHPERYVKDIKLSEEDKVKAAKDIKKLGLDLCLHTIIGNGFKKNAFNYIGLIPDSFYTHAFERRNNKEAISINDYLLEQGRLISSRPNTYFSKKELIRFFRIFGEMISDGKVLVQRKNFRDAKTVVPAEFTIPEGNDSTYTMLIGSFGKGKSRKTGVFIKNQDKSDSSKSVYVNISKTSNNKKHILGGDFLNKDEAGLEFAFSAAAPVLDTAKNQPPRTDVIQLCMLK